MPVGVGSVMVQSRADVSNGQFYVAVARALAEEHQRTAGCSRTREEGLTTDTFLITLAITISISGDLFWTSNLEKNPELS